MSIYIVVYLINSIFGYKAFSFLQGDVGYVVYLLGVLVLFWGSIRNNERLVWWKNLIIIGLLSYFLSRPEVVDLFKTELHISFPLLALLLYGLLKQLKLRKNRS